MSELIRVNPCTLHPYFSLPKFSKGRGGGVDMLIVNGVTAVLMVDAYCVGIILLHTYTVDASSMVIRF